MRNFSDIRKITNNKGQKYYLNTLLPNIPKDQNDIYVITVEGDRLDNLSNEFYGSPKFWWVIASANPDKLRKDSYNVPGGLQIRIPIEPSTYLNVFNSFNKSHR